MNLLSSIKQKKKELYYYTMAEIYWEGNKYAKLPNDKNKAIELYKKSESLGYIKAAETLSLIYLGKYSELYNDDFLEIPRAIALMDKHSWFIFPGSGSFI